MKAATNFFLFIVLLIFASCISQKKDPTENEVRIVNGKPYDFSKVQFLNIGNYLGDTLVGYPAYVEESSNHKVYIQSITLTIDSTELRGMVGNTLNIRNVKAKRTVNIETRGPSQVGAPGNFKDLVLKQVYVVIGGDTVTVVQDVKLKEFQFENYVLYDREKTTSEKAAKEVMENMIDLQDRLNRLQEIIDSLMAVHPDHAAETLNDDLTIIEKKLSEIRYRYSNGRKPELGQIHIDKGLLLSIDFSLSDMKEEVLDPTNNPSALENSVFFKTGRFLVTEEVSNRYVDNFIDRVVDNVRLTTRENGIDISDIKINLKVTGYADDQDVGDSLEVVFRQSITESVFASYADKQEILNIELSRRRGKAVLEYLQQRIRNELGVLEDSVFANCVSDGKGKSVYPETVQPGSCPGKCANRRVTLVSCIIYTRIE